MPRLGVPKDTKSDPLVQAMADLLRDKAPAVHEAMSSAAEDLMGPGNPPVHMALKVMDRVDPLGTIALANPMMAAQRATAGALRAARGISQEERAANFANWFGKSKIVDAQGAPATAYHMTPASFDTFKMGKKTSGGEYLSGEAAWFAPTPELTHAAHNTHFGDFQARKNGAHLDKTGEYISGTNVMPVHLKLENPLEIHAGDVAGREARRANGLPTDSVYLTPENVSKMKELGIDGVIKYGEDFNPLEYVVLDRKQVKSVFNRGTYSLTDPNILKSVLPVAGTAELVDLLRSDK